MTYLLDANIFIQAKNLYYNFDICPAFWDWLDRENIVAPSVKTVFFDSQAMVQFSLSLSSF